MDQVTLRKIACLFSTTVTADESWSRDPIGDCAVWTGDASTSSVISWTGECADGKGSGCGVLTVFDAGRVTARFHGRMTPGKAVG